MKEIEDILERNKRVEREKAWEICMTRRVVIASITYVCASVWLIKIGNEEPFLNALVPMGGYILSTWSLPFIKEIWIKKYDR